MPKHFTHKQKEQLTQLDKLWDECINKFNKAETKEECDKYLEILKEIFKEWHNLHCSK